MRTFIVECYWPGMSEEDARNALARISLDSEVTREPSLLLWLGCVLVPSDGMALFLFRAPSEDEVRRVSLFAEVPFDRIVESVLVGFGEPPT